MRIQLLSDLHLESHPHFVAQALPGADVLVLAGDVGSYQTGSRLTDTDFGLGRFSPRASNSPWPVVVYVPGNHEYDELEYGEAHARLRETCDRLGIVWLERESVVIDGVRFVGTTLWADFDAMADAPGACLGETQRLRLREKAFRSANHYLRRHSTRVGGQPMLAEGMRELSLQCQAWLREALRVPHEGPVVVVTHFAPSLRSADPRYGVGASTAGFCNSLDDLLPQADLWLHGHLHCPIDYRAEPAAAGQRRCRVVANPLGYARKGEQDGFRSDLLIDVGGPPA